MSKASVMFIVPEDCALLAEEVEAAGGRFEDVEDGSPALEWLSANPGVTTSIEFEDCVDPIDAVRVAVSHLKEAAVPYIAVADSFTERSRGIRVEGTVIVNFEGTPDGEKSVSYPWTLGEPECDERTLRNAGFADEEAAEVGRVFFRGTPEPRY